MADGGVYVNSNGDWVRAGGAGGGIDVESDREHQLLQGDDAQGWVPGMAMSVVDAVPADTDGEIGDVVFVTGPGDGGSPSSSGVVLQRTRLFCTEAADTTEKTFVPVNGMSMKITPKKANSHVYVTATFKLRSIDCADQMQVRIVNTAGTAMNGAVNCAFHKDLHEMQATLIGYDEPGSTSEQTYTVEFMVGGAGGGTAHIRNNHTTGLMIADEVSP